mmetsp:Transcript_45877/g.109241  ORF Transcript_45877/g.109241 Transcript_45877/m.109241 type:complete len:673 (-) Transcript_45877:90-2108(-)
MAETGWAALGLVGFLLAMLETAIPVVVSLIRRGRGGQAAPSRKAKHLGAGLKPFYSDRDWDSIGSQLLKVPSEFLLEERQTLEAFGSKVGAATLPRCSLQMPIRRFDGGSKRVALRVYVRALRRARVFMIGIASFGLLVTWYFRYLLGDVFKVNPEDDVAVLRALEMLSDAHGILAGLCVFVIALYALQCVARLHRVMDLAMAVKGSVSYLGFLLGANFQPPLRSDPVIKMVLWTVFRLANAAHFYTYTGLSERLHVACQEQSLAEVGLLTEDELDALDKFENKAIAVLHWLSDLVYKLISAEIIPDAPAHAMLDGLGELMKSVNAVDFEVRSGQPVMLLRLVHAMLTVTCMLSPFAFLNTFQVNDTMVGTAVSMYLWASLGSAFVAFILKTAVNIAGSIESPLFGGHDSLNVDQILLTTETFIYNYLSGDSVVPDLVARVAEVEPLPLPPPVDRSLFQDEPERVGGAYEHELDMAEMRSMRSVRSDASRLSDDWIGSEVSFQSKASRTSSFSGRSGRGGRRKWDARFSSRRSRRGSSASGSIAQSLGGASQDLDDADMLLMNLPCGVSRELLEARWSQVEKPRKVTLDEASLRCLEDALVRPLAALVSSLPGAGPNPQPATYPKVSQLSTASTPFGGPGGEMGLSGLGPQGHTTRPDAPSHADEEPEELTI